MFVCSGKKTRRLEDRSCAPRKPQSCRSESAISRSSAAPAISRTGYDGTSSVPSSSAEKLLEEAPVLLVRPFADPDGVSDGGELFQEGQLLLGEPLLIDNA